MARNALKIEFEFYLRNQTKLVKKYNGRYLLIFGNRVRGDFESYDSAYIFGSKKYKLGKFLIQKCSPGEEDYAANIFYKRLSKK
ncbi:MAG: hypothetical protein Athens071416_184 [Parcubacteria group bacterium Athens0714_16]|nr:MAG: hypothetical protein Athens071416_184 [Parcubacteria group bacterium Athens0714_16]